MAVSAEIIKAAQEAYAARPWSARVETSHSATTQRFHTEGEAIAYIFQQAANVRRYMKEWRARGDNCWIGFDARRSYVEGPSGQRMQARWVLLQDSFSTSDR